MHKYSFLIISLAALLQSCTSIKQMSFDQLQPAVFSFPEQIKSVAVVSTVPQVKIGNIDIANSTPFTGDQKVSKEALAKEIADNGYFDKVVVCDSVINSSSKDFETNSLSTKTVLSLLEEFDVDMIISLENMDMRMKRVSGVPYGYDFDIIECITTPELKYYIPKRMPLFYTAKSDTVYYSLLELVDAKNMINRACEDAIWKSTDIVLPHWRNVSRFYFSGGNYEMRDAALAMNENDWDSSYKLWKSVYDNKKGKLKDAAAFNIALYYEIMDDIKEALKWLDIASENIKENDDLYSVTQTYKNLLQERDKQLFKLRIQMNRFKSNN